MTRDEVDAFWAERLKQAEAEAAEKKIEKEVSRDEIHHLMNAVNMA